MISSHDTDLTHISKALQRDFDRKLFTGSNGAILAGRHGVSRADRPGCAGASATLPCLYSNNSIGTVESSSLGEENEAVRSLVSLLSPYSKKQAHTLYSNVERFVSVVAKSQNHVAFFTLTFPDKVYDHKEASKRWNSLNSNYLKKHSEFGHWLRVSEQHLDGSWHFHCLVECDQDIKSDFDFDVYQKWLDDYRRTGKRKRLNTGSAYLRGLWFDLRENLKTYGFGRSELVPIRSNAEAMGRYVGKYISKHMGQRQESSRGVRLVSYSRGWSKNSVKMVWLSDNTREWRRKVRLFAEYHGCSELYQLSAKLGPTWAYKFIEDIYNIDEILINGGGAIMKPYSEQCEKTIRDRKRQRENRIFKNLETHRKVIDHKAKCRVKLSAERYALKILPLPCTYYGTHLPSEVPF